ncbi:MAG: ice-binding family protein [Acidobacteria bacterium]|nr:ice-binding family protein [Acidobacteriota bacterium]
MRRAFQRCAPRVVCIILFAALLYGPSLALAGPILGSAQDFAVLGHETVTNTGTTNIWGNVGVYDGTSITGFPPGIVHPPGTIYEGGGVAQQAQIDAAAAYAVLAGWAFTSDLTGKVLGVGTEANLGPGTYKFSSSAGLTGTLTLDAQNDPNARFVFQIGSSLTTDSSSTVNVINGRADTGVFWLVGSFATLGTSTTFAGNILAHTEAITLTTSATILCGRAFSLNAAVTMDGNTISNDCISYGGGRSDFGSAGFSGTASAVPEPGSITLLSTGLLSLILFGWRSRKPVA